jgi:hypothetical protein
MRLCNTVKMTVKSRERPYIIREICLNKTPYWSVLLIFQVKTAVCDLIVRAAAAQPDIGLLIINTLNRL